MTTSEHADVSALFAELSSVVEVHDGAHAVGSAFHDQEPLVTLTLDDIRDQSVWHDHWKMAALHGHHGRKAESLIQEELDRLAEQRGAEPEKRRQEREVQPTRR